MSEESSGFFSTLYDYGSPAVSTVWDFTVKSTIGDSYQLYMNPDQFIGETLYQRARSSQSQVGIGHIGPDWAWFLPKVVMVTDRRAFSQVTNYGEPTRPVEPQQVANYGEPTRPDAPQQVANSDENKIPGDPAARKSFDFLKPLLGQEVSNNLQGPAAMAARAELKPFVHSDTFSTLHDHSKVAFENFLSTITKHPEEAFTHSVYGLVAEILGHCVFGVTSELNKADIPDLMQIANLITSPLKSDSQIRKAHKRLEEISAELLKKDGSKSIDPEKFIAVHAAITDEMSEDEKIERLTAQNISGSYLAAVNPYNLIVKTMVAISKDPALRSALLNELTDPETEKPEKLRKAPLLEAVYCEALRSFSPSLVVRNTSRFFKLSTVDNMGAEHETIVPPYSFMFVPILAQHMDEDLWEKPREFNPERFLVDKKLKKLLNTFSVGIRSCPAQSGFTELLFKELIRLYVLSIATLELTEEVEETPIYSINTGWKKPYYLKQCTLRDRDNSKGKEANEAEPSDEEFSNEESSEFSLGR
ncbi:MAG: cytochrome P450 [Legionella sp.]|nr:cytochrome P450 [Legionella sp.]